MASLDGFDLCRRPLWYSDKRETFSGNRFSAFPIALRCFGTKKVGRRGVKHNSTTEHRLAVGLAMRSSHAANTENSIVSPIELFHVVD
jgi:hypothetical protein